MKALWTKLISHFVTLRVKLILLAVYTGIIVFGTIHGYNIVLDARQSHITERQRNAPVTISKFQQDLRKTHVQETPCFSTAIPDDVIKLLR